jgi:hypothetical protein
MTKAAEATSSVELLPMWTRLLTLWLIGQTAAEDGHLHGQIHATLGVSARRYGGCKWTVLSEQT